MNYYRFRPTLQDHLTDMWYVSRKLDSEALMVFGFVATWFQLCLLAVS